MEVVKNKIRMEVVKNKTSRMNFIKKLSVILSLQENEAAPPISWLAEGNGFAIHSYERFRSMLPNYFVQSKFKSFERQLSNYGFWQEPTSVCESLGVQKVYRHKEFHRDKPELNKEIKRVFSKKMELNGRSNQGGKKNDTSNLSENRNNVPSSDKEPQTLCPPSLIGLSPEHTPCQLPSANGKELNFGFPYLKAAKIIKKNEQIVHITKRQKEEREKKKRLSDSCERFDVSALEILVHLKKTNNRSKITDQLIVFCEEELKEIKSIMNRKKSKKYKVCERSSMEQDELKKMPVSVLTLQEPVHKKMMNSIPEKLIQHSSNIKETYLCGQNYYVGKKIGMEPFQQSQKSPAPVSNHYYNKHDSSSSRKDGYVRGSKLKKNRNKDMQNYLSSEEQDIADPNLIDKMLNFLQSGSPQAPSDSASISYKDTNSFQPTFPPSCAEISNNGNFGNLDCVSNISIPSADAPTNKTIFLNNEYGHGTFFSNMSLSSSHIGANSLPSTNIQEDHGVKLTMHDSKKIFPTWKSDYSCYLADTSDNTIFLESQMPRRVTDTSTDKSLSLPTTDFNSFLSGNQSSFAKVFANTNEVLGSIQYGSDSFPIGSEATNAPSFIAHSQTLQGKFNADSALLDIDSNTNTSERYGDQNC